jgi:N-acetylglucosamine-6-sulfatase
MPHARVPFQRLVPTARPLSLLAGLLFVALVATVVSLPPQNAVAAAAGPAVAAAVNPPPNVLLVSTDDQAATDMRFMPFTRKYFANNGVTFDDAVSPFPLCCPARATILTGQLSHNHHVLTNRAPYGGYEAFVANGNEDTTLPTWLQTAGYQTMFVGKYLNGYGEKEYLKRWPTGWSHWNGLAGKGVYSFYDFELARDGVITPYPNGYNTTVFGQITRSFIQRSARGTQPFFIWESDLAPHGGCQRVRTRPGCAWGPPKPARSDRDAFRKLQLNSSGDESFNERVVVDKPRHVRDTRAWNRAKLGRMTSYLRQRARSLLAVDRSFRATVGKLRQLGELDDTLVVFTSDNGFLIGEHRWHGKTLPYEPSLRVPLMMSGPGIPAGVRSDETVALVDIAATIARATGATPTVEQDGRPLQPVANGTAQGYGALSIEAGPLKAADYPTWFYHGVRTKRYKYVVYPGLGEFELYDRRTDPDETTNVAYRPAYRETRAALAAKLRQLNSCAGEGCLGVSGGGVPRPEPEPYLDSGATVHPDELGSVGRARQVVTVTAPSWRTGRGRLTAWVRHRRTWTVARGPFAVRLGSHGMVQGPRRRQGAGETPAGTFTPKNAFGLRPPVKTQLPYRKVDRDDYWVFDPKEPATYNVEQPGRSPRATWRKRYSVRWAAEAKRFPRAILMDYNLPHRVTSSREFGERRSAAPADVRKGSFVLHAGRTLGNNGWVSMGARKLTWLLRWTRTGGDGARFVVGTPRYLRGRL